MSLFRNRNPCCCSGPDPCCNRQNLADCVGITLKPSCCEGEATITVCKSGGPPLNALPGSDERRTGFTPDDWCWSDAEEKFILDQVPIGISCAELNTEGLRAWVIAIQDDPVDNHLYFPGIPNTIVANVGNVYMLELVSCDPFLATFGGQAGCDGECTYMWVPACFLGNTIISSPDGDKQISELKVGDSVYGKDNNIVVVERIYEETHNIILFIQDQNDNWTGVTPEHPFLLDDTTYKTITAGELNVGMTLANGMTVQKIWSSKTVSKVYNLSVSGDNTFIANGWLVHNK